MSIKLRCIRDDGDKDGGSISAPLCTNKTLAKIRGKRYLDDPEQGNYFDTEHKGFNLRFKQMLKPGDMIYVDSERSGGGLYKCLSFGVTITPDSITSSGEFIRYGS